ncbi:MAG: SpoIID/LytB domain-containing protein [Proteobacteria bacterium]|nr:SpoIID/LytB domain-containing protein [Pseudomonadota bacterium]
MKSPLGLKASGVALKSGEKTKITVKRVSSRKVMVNNRLIVEGSLWVSGQGSIKVLKIGSSIGRRYMGTIEIKPYGRGVYVINHIPVESYLEGVLNAEISTKWSIEVVKAQTVISRTYALHKREKRSKYAWHLSSGHFDQVYKGVDIADARGKLAIRSTYGIVVNYRGNLAQTFYHSNCGGMTEDPGNIWQYALPYLKIKSVPYGQKDPRYRWEITIPNSDIERILERAGMPMDGVQNVFVDKRTSSNRAYQLVFTGNRTRKLSAYDFRKLAGYRRIQSLMFDVVRVPNGFHFQGKGNGHGVGLSQWAAKEMAEVGYKYHEILHYFYTDVELGRYSG